mgnify:CR=1 FL=1
MPDNPVDRRSAPRFAATFRIRLGYPDIDAFLDGYAVNISKGGIYVPTKQPRERGTEVRFELLLKDGNPAVAGVGRVAWSKPFDPQKPGERYGMGVQFLALEGASADIVRKAMAWREKHGHGDKEVTEEGESKAAPPGGEEPKAAERKPEPQPAAPRPQEHEPQPAAPRPQEQAPEHEAPARDRTGLARKVLGQRKVTMGNVDDLLASLRGKEAAKRPAVAPPPPEPETAAPEPPAMPPAEPPAEPPAAESGSASPDEVSAYVIAGVESARIPSLPSPEAEPAAAGPEPPPGESEASPVLETGPKPLPQPQPKTDDNMPSLEDLEAALASVSVPPPPPGLDAPPAEPALDIEVGAAAVAARGARTVPHDAEGLELPAWDEEPPAPTLSEQLAQSGPLPAVGEEEGVSQVLEATDDLDLESLPKSTRELRAVQRRTKSTPPSDLFEDIPGAAPPEPPSRTTAEPELPVVGGVVPSKVEDALRQKIAGMLGGTEDGETAVMTQDEQAKLDQLMQSQVPSRPSVADLPPPPDMPAPIPEAPVEGRKSGFFGKLFGKKKK